MNKKLIMVRFILLQNGTKLQLGFTTTETDQATTDAEIQGIGELINSTPGCTGLCSIGCGDGDVEIRLARTYPYRHVTATDVANRDNIRQAKQNGVPNIDFRHISQDAEGGQLVEEDEDLVVDGRIIPLFLVPATEALFIRRPTKADVRGYIREYTGQLIILLATERAKLTVDEVEEILHEKDGVWIPVAVGDHCFIYRKQ